MRGFLLQGESAPIQRGQSFGKVGHSAHAAAGHQGAIRGADPIRRIDFGIRELSASLRKAENRSHPLQKHFKSVQRSIVDDRADHRGQRDIINALGLIRGAVSLSQKMSQDRRGGRNGSHDQTFTRRRPPEEEEGMAAAIDWAAKASFSDQASSS